MSRAGKAFKYFATFRQTGNVLRRATAIAVSVNTLSGFGLGLSSSRSSSSRLLGAAPLSQELAGPCSELGRAEIRKLGQQRWFLGLFVHGNEEARYPGR